jgi:hypothetical protein
VALFRARGGCAGGRLKKPSIPTNGERKRTLRDKRQFVGIRNEQKFHNDVIIKSSHYDAIMETLYEENSSRGLGKAHFPTSGSRP